MLKEFGLWSEELEFVDSLLQLDLRNNSAWNQRFFVIYNTTGFTADVIAREVAYVNHTNTCLVVPQVIIVAVFQLRSSLHQQSPE